MILSVSLSGLRNDALSNRFDPTTAQPGWYKGAEYSPDCHFFSGELLPVNPGDVVYFGPAVIGQGWHMTVYAAGGIPLREVTLGSGVEAVRDLNGMTALLCYRAEPEVAFVRLICDTRLLYGFTVTIGRPFTAEDLPDLGETAALQPVFHLSEQVFPHWTILCNLTGHGTMIVGKKPLAFEPGTVVCIPPHTTFEKHSREGFTDLRISATEFLPGQPEAVRVVADDENRSLTALAEICRRSFWRPDAYSPQLTRQVLDTLSAAVEARARPVPPRDARVAELIRSLWDRFTDPALSVEQLLIAGDYCPNHMRRLFKAETGESPRDYLIRLRIDHAKKLLRENGGKKDSVTRIAALSGFEDVCYFSRVFRQKTGLSPTAYAREAARSAF